MPNRFNHGFENHSLPVAAFPSVALFPQLGSRITRIPKVNFGLILNVGNTADTFVFITDYSSQSLAIRVIRVIRG
jgi:hypothetical protein